MIESLIIAFSMYSKIPMPHVSWDKESMRYVMCFFPCVGITIGLLMWGWSYISGQLALGTIFVSTVYVLLPIFVTGGIHLDGFMDTMDALSSYQPVERRLEILKDPHTGAFAILSFGVYMAASIAIWSELEAKQVPVLAVGFVLSRALSGLSVTTFPCAKNSGLAATFSQNADKEKSKAVLLGECIVAVALMIVLQPVQGSVAVVAALCVFAYYYRMSSKKFGGITGDLAGWFLCVTELMMALAVMVVAK